MGSLGSLSVFLSFYEVWEFESPGSGCFEWADFSGNARLTLLSGPGLAVVGPGAPKTNKGAGVQHLIRHQEACLSFQWPAATAMPSARVKKRRHKIAPVMQS